MRPAPSQRVSITPIGGTVHQVDLLVGESGRQFVGLIREASPGVWRTDGQNFTTAAAASDHVVRARS